MLDYLFRQILLLIQPVGLAWLTLLVLAIALWRMRNRRLAALSGGMCMLITLFGSTDFPGWLLRRMERPWAGVKIADLPACDAVIVLGGGTEPSRYEVNWMHLSRAGDRVIMGLELMRLGKARAIALGGNVADFDGEKKVEADVVKAWLQSQSLPAGAEIISLGANSNTHDEGEKVARLAKERGWQRVLLVTSASHMQRAVAVFRKLGIETIAAPCNFLTSVSTAPPSFRLSVPGYDGFEKFAVWMHEQVGWFIYKRRGWV